MSNILKVTLVPYGTGFAVDIDESGNANHMPRAKGAQRISWQLSKNAYKGSMVSFAWQKPYPPSSVFGPAVQTFHKKHLNMDDVNDSTASAGTWTYKLTIEVDGKQYSTVSSTIRAATINNPTIRNN